MKFYYDETVIYYDDGYFPSLNKKEGIVKDFDNHLGPKYLVVEFILDTGKKFTASLPIEKFKKIKNNKNK